MISNQEVGLARPTDVQRIAAMSRDLIEFGLGWKWTSRRILHCVHNPVMNVAVAREHDRVTGFAIMQYLEDEAHLVLFAVDAAHRRRGIGSALLAWLEKTARTAGIGIVYLEARLRNRGAREFYRTHGYVETGILHGHYRGIEDGVRIARDLWS